MAYCGFGKSSHLKIRAIDLGEDTHRKIRETVFESIKCERQRQIDKGFDPVHDDMICEGELIYLASIYLHQADNNRCGAERLWWCHPFPPDQEDRDDPVPDRGSVELNLITVAALIVAELERLARTKAREEASHG